MNVFQLFWQTLYVFIFFLTNILYLKTKNAYSLVYKLKFSIKTFIWQCYTDLLQVTSIAVRLRGTWLVRSIGKGLLYHLPVWKDFRNQSLLKLPFPEPCDKLFSHLRLPLWRLYLYIEENPSFQTRQLFICFIRVMSFLTNDCFGLMKCRGLLVNERYRI